MQMLVGWGAVGLEDDGDRGAAGDGAGLLRLESPRPLPGAGAIPTLMRTMTIVGCGTGTSGRTSAHSPMPGTNGEL